MAHDLYMIIDVFTAECYAGIGTKEVAMQHIADEIQQNGGTFVIVTKDNYDEIMELNENDDNVGKFIMVVPCEWTENSEEAELVIYPSWNKSSLYGEVAEYIGDITNYDILDTSDEYPVKIIDHKDYESEDE